ncbi:MAG: hypothetical protein IH819_09745, partial [Bacteroidetes bacterium]|nr:hypothetical protein [Bacteroidota bacterium]
MKIKEIIKRLKEGNKRFISNTADRKLRDSTRRDLLAAGQSPFAAILGCSDSRVVPEIIFDTGLGELFTVRVAGNIANTSSIASIEFSVAQLNVRLVLVKGHSNCGAVTAAVEGGVYGNNLNRLFNHIAPAIEQTPGGNIDEIIKKNAELNGLGDRIQFINQDFTSSKIVKYFPEKVHVLVSHPPYVSPAAFEDLPEEIKNYDPA